jgi:hypothetical protein
MVCTPFFQEFVLLALLWQLVISYWTWRQSQAPPYPLPQRTTQPPKGAKPFAGLTHKPHCLACEQAPAPGSPAPRVPPPRLASPQGRPRQVDSSAQFCPTPHCVYYGWVGRGNLRANGYPSGGRWRQFQCLSCRKYFLETQGTPHSGGGARLCGRSEHHAALGDGGGGAGGGLLTLFPP